jgi:threonine/homoserine/homoserine lactone efflux protein
VGTGIGEVLPFAVGIAISPIPIIAIIAMLFTPKARVNGPMFLLGWVGGLSILAAVVYFAAGAFADASSGPAPWVSWLRIVLGVFLLIEAWRKRTPELDGNGAAKLPRWMSRIDDVSPRRALRLGVLLSSVNPKNLALAIGGIAGLAQDDLGATDSLTALIVFVVVASSTIAAAIAYYFLGGTSAQEHLSSVKDWMAQHNSAVMSTLFVVFGVVLISNGVASL